MRRSRYAEMVLEAEYWKVEEHELVNSHLRVEMSPLPTRLNRQNAEYVEGYVCLKRRLQPQMYGGYARTERRTQPDLGISIDLQYARIKTATSNLTNTLEVRHTNEGRHEWNAKGVAPR